MRETEFRFWDKKRRKFVYSIIKNRDRLFLDDCNAGKVFINDIVKQRGIRGGCYNNKDRIFLIDDNVNTLNLYADGYYDFKVIGNIYENSELLEIK